MIGADEERMRLALDAARMGSFVWFLQEDRTVPDERMRALLGVEPGGTITLADALATLINPGDRARYAEAVGQSIDPSGDGALRQGIRFVYRDGTVRWIDLSARTYFDDNGEPWHMGGVVSDVTGRVVADRARAHLAVLVASSQIAIVTLSLAGVITTWNRGAARMLGIAAADAIDLHATQMVPDVYIDTVREMFEMRVAGNATSPGEIQLRGSDGAAIDVSPAMSLIVADDGDVLGVSVLSRNITAQKQADDQARAREQSQRRAERHGEIVGKLLAAIEPAETRTGRARALLTQLAPALADSAAVRLQDGTLVDSTSESTAWTDEFPMRVGAEILATLLIAGERWLAALPDYLRDHPPSETA